jgi:hypothetical protein
MAMRVRGSARRARLAFKARRCRPLARALKANDLGRSEAGARQSDDWCRVVNGRQNAIGCLMTLCARAREPERRA